MIEQEVRTSLSVFSDPATQLSVSALDDKHCGFEFTRNGKEYQGKAAYSDGDLRVKLLNREWQSLQSFLASEEMANLDALARVQQRIYSQSKVLDFWVDGPAELDNGDVQPASSLFREGAVHVDGETKILVLDGPAGMGKTTLVNKIAYDQSRAFLDRRSNNLVLIVSSRGRKLSRLNDAIAATLQDFRIKIYYPEIPILVKYGLIKLVIDGFDELVNSDGYKSAWRSLSELIDSVNGGGTLVLSSRDTFFSEQMFIQRAQRRDAVWEGKITFSFLRLRAWTKIEANLLLEKYKVLDAHKEGVMQFFEDSSYSSLLRPFFIKHLTDILNTDDYEDDSGLDPDRIIHYVVEGFLQRETALLSPDSSVSSSMLRRFFHELCVEMRNQERATVELDVVHFYLDGVLEEEGIDEETRNQLVYRSGSVAFLDVSDEDQRGRRGFPHQIVGDYFFIEYLLITLSKDISELEDLLSLGVFGLDLSEMAVAVVEVEPELGIAGRHVQQLFTLASDRSTSSIVSMNSATIACALMRTTLSDSYTGYTCKGVAFGNVSLKDVVLPNWSVADSSFGFLDLSNSIAIELRLDTTHVQQMRVSNLTVLPPEWDVYPVILEVQQASKILVYKDSAKIKEKIDLLKAPSPNAKVPTTEATAGENLLDKITRRWLRQYYVDLTDSQEEPSLNHRLWPEVFKILKDSNRIYYAVLPKSDKRQKLYHMKEARALLERKHEDPAKDQEIKDIWEKVRSLE